MEGLTTRTLVFGGIMAAFGAYLLLAPKPSYAEKTEQDMEKLAPKNVGEFRMRPGSENPEQSYKMPESTYETLKPYGIVCRLLESTAGAYDVVVIASRNRASFHDPRGCFTSQGWELLEQREIEIPTKTRDTVKATWADMRQVREDRDGQTLFLFRGPGGQFFSNTNSLKFAMFMEQLQGGKDIDGVFYRFIPQNRDTTLEQMKEFVANYLDTAKETSNGYF